MAKSILSFAIAFLAVMTVFASAAEMEDENSTISTAWLDNDETIETEAMPEDEPKTTRNVGCKKFFPSIGRSLTVPCGVEASAPSLSTSMRQDKSLWATIKDSDKVSDFEFYLSRFPKGRYSAVAELKIEQLKVAHARAVAAKTPPPSIREDSPSIKKDRKRRAPKRVRSRRASGGSCGGCRNSCYVRYRVRSNSRQFVPCMRRCWKQLCR